MSDGDCSHAVVPGGGSVKPMDESQEALSELNGARAGVAARAVIDQGEDPVDTGTVESSFV